MPLPHKHLPDQEVRRNFEAVDDRFPIKSQDIADEAVTQAKLGTVYDHGWEMVESRTAVSTGLGLLSASNQFYTEDGVCVTKNRGNSFGLFYLNDGHYGTTAANLEIKLELTAFTNSSVAIGISVRFCLFPVSSSVGGAGLHDWTVATEVCNYLLAAPAASAEIHEESDVGAFPSDGWFMLGARGSGNQVANSSILHTLKLWVRRVAP